MAKQLIFILGLVFMLTPSLFAQKEEVDLTKNFRFNDGIYFSYEAFRKNSPDLEWSQLRSSLFTNPQTYLTTVDYIFHGLDTLNLENLWGICLDGLPFIRLPKGAIETKNRTAFAGLLLRGKICYFEYQQQVERMVPISAYNPLTRKPFRTANVKRKITEYYDRILHFDTGEVAEFNLENIKKWVKDDEDVLPRLSSMDPEADRDNLLQIIINYNDRNIVFVPE